MKQFEDLLRGMCKNNNISKIVFKPHMREKVINSLRDDAIAADRSNVYVFGDTLRAISEDRMMFCTSSGFVKVIFER